MVVMGVGHGRIQAAIEDVVSVPGVRAIITPGLGNEAGVVGPEISARISARVADAGIAMIGPNCMGMYNRRLGVRHSADQPAGDAGNVAFIGQSGTHTINFSLVGSMHGIKCSKTVSFGNAVLLDAPDYLDYFAQDPETEVIAMYIEGVKDVMTVRRVFGEVADPARLVDRGPDHRHPGPDGRQQIHPRGGVEHMVGEGGADGLDRAAHAVQIPASADQVRSGTEPRPRIPELTSSSESRASGWRPSPASARRASQGEPLSPSAIAVTRRRVRHCAAYQRR